MTVVKGDQKTSFSIAITPRCMGRHYSFSWIPPHYLDTYLILLSVKQEGIKYHFLSLWYDATWDWTQVFRQTLYPLDQWSRQFYLLTICQGAKATMQTFPCGYRVVCPKCFIKTIQVVVSRRRLPPRCVICRTQILKLRQNPQPHSERREGML